MSVEKLNRVELEKGTQPAASWHRDFRDTNTVYVGNLPEEMNEHDLLIMFSQWGSPTAVRLARDTETGVSRRFAFITYEDWNSTVLAVDNFDSYSIVPGSKLRVNHAYYKGRKVVENDAVVEWENAVAELLKEDMA